MRALVCILALILALPAIVATTDADAKIKPIPRPDEVIGKPAAAASRSTSVAPISRPVIHRNVVVGTKKAVVRRTRPATHAATRTVRAPVRTHRRARVTAASRVHRVRVLARSRGGRYVPPAISHGGRQLPPVVAAAPKPTPLGFVAAGELLPSSDDPWPSWVFSLLGIMAASEVYLLVHLARARSFV